MKHDSKKLISAKKSGVRAAVLILAVLMTAGAVFTGAAAAGLNTTVSSTAFYYENVSGSSGTYKYLDNTLFLDGMQVLDTVASHPAGTYVNTSPGDTVDGIMLKKLDAEITMYVHDDDGNVIYSCIGGTVPQGAKVSFKVNPNLPTAYTASTLNAAFPLVGLKFIGPDGSGKSTFLGTQNYGEYSPARWSVLPLDSNLTEGTWTVWAYFVPVGTSGLFASYTPDEYLNGQKFTFTIVTSKVSMSAESDTAKVGGYVTITVCGKPNDVYYLKPNEKYEVNPGQANFDYITNEVTIDKDGTTTLTLKALDSGTFTLQLCSDAAMKVVEEDLELTFTKAKITAEVEKDSYYMGTDVKLIGTNEALYPLYYYIEGTNLPFRKIDDANLKLIKSSKEWETTIKGDYIKDLKLDTAAYTIYISSINATKKDDVISSLGVYTAVGVRLIQPTVTITSSPGVVVQGDKLTVKGVAESAANVQYYIFGTNKFYNGTVDAGKNGAFTLEKTILKEQYDAGQYFVVIQHPMYDGVYNIAPVEISAGVMAIALNNTGQATAADNILFTLNERQSSNAAQALCDAIDSEDIDDICTKFSFIVTAEGTQIDPIPSQIIRGYPLTVSGSTNKEDGDAVIVELLSTAFTAASKYSATTASFITLTATPDENGKWAVTFKTDGLNPDDYTVTVTTGTVVSNPMPVKIVEGPVPTNSVPADAATALPTAVPVKTTEAKSPGFGIAALLLGLGAAVLLKKRA
ncbi:MAG TPA: hypothetical protein O0X97_03015 [Methanocorpusculum sp.]|nr:hypothetical protein [Methanocorpusculum sp.]